MRMFRSLAVAFLITIPLACYSQSKATGDSQSDAATSAAPPISILVFSDFECPYSAQLYFELQKLRAKLPGQVHVTYKQSPLPIHPDSPLAHKAALAAGKQGRYDAMAELLYTNQKPQDVASLTAFANQLHLDVARFRKDLNSPSVAAELAADMEESRAFAVNQTPTMFMNGKPLIGFQSEETLATLIGSSEVQNATAVTPDADGAPIDPTLLAAIQTAPTASQGAKDAPLTIIEFTDFQCPFCRAAVAPMEQFVAARGREVRWIVRAFPLDFHPDSELATEAALAAGEQGKFWQMHDLIFGNQSAIKADNLRAYAEQLHLDMHAFDDALATHRFAGQIAADRALGMKAGVTGTPTFFIDGRPVTGVRSLPELNQLADAHSAMAAGKLTAVGVVVPILPANAPDQEIEGLDTRAPVTLTWFVDVRSPLAARQAELVRDLAKQYDGKIRVLFRAFPLESHADGHISSAALLASLKQDKFWTMFDALAGRRDLLDRTKLVSIADEIGLDRSKFSTDLDSSSSAVDANVNEAVRRGIQGAPVIFLNKQRVDGLQQKQFYTAILDQELQKAPSVQASVAR
jgi:protein-disulfide isomerase